MARDMAAPAPAKAVVAGHGHDPVQARFLAKVSHRLHITSFKSTPSRSSRTAVNGVMVFMPPGAAKSTYLWLMGRKKGTNVIAISYSQDVANRSGGAFAISAFRRRCPIMDTAIVADNHAVDNWALENGSDYRAAGANASVTSVRADWVLIDDHPVKGRESADSDLQRETIWTTLNDDVFTRMKPNAKILIAMTRRHARVKSRLRSSRSIRRRGGCPMMWNVHMPACVSSVIDTSYDRSVMPTGGKPSSVPIQSRSGATLS